MPAPLSIGLQFEALYHGRILHVSRSCESAKRHPEVKIFVDNNPTKMCDIGWDDERFDLLHTALTSVPCSGNSRNKVKATRIW
ncbi:hypothetical protein PsorP6_008754 [Peronosclerospora sorghi]|uniref:Uncharacterized protein n=1 Tax=Peronosclerospora sorghi TaxID=230839 RepID=A0ACC0VZ08_9STRA|nr:hypothetical protein PsorP6_008754 [Peronosclerospora sorghi]